MLKFSELQTSRSFDVCPLLFCSSMEWWTVGSLLLAKDNYLVWTNVAANDDRLKNFPAIVWDWSHPSLNGYMDNFPACFQSSIHSVCLSNHQIGKVRMDPVLLTWTTPGWLDINIEYFKNIKNNSQTCPQMYLDQLILDWQIACYWEISKPSAFSGHPWQGGVKELAHAQKHEKHHLSWGVSLKKRNYLLLLRLDSSWLTCDWGWIRAFLCYFDTVSRPLGHSGDVIKESINRLHLILRR